jgi:hypothetical protein
MNFAGQTARTSQIRGPHYLLWAPPLRYCPAGLRRERQANLDPRSHGTQTVPWLAAIIQARKKRADLERVAGERLLCHGLWGALERSDARVSQSMTAQRDAFPPPLESLRNIPKLGREPSCLRLLVTPGMPTRRVALMARSSAAQPPCKPPPTSLRAGYSRSLGKNFLPKGSYTLGYPAYVRLPTSNCLISRQIKSVELARALP